MTTVPAPLADLTGRESSGSLGSSDAAVPLSASGLRLRLVIAGLTCLAVACALLACALNTSDRPTTAVVWGGFALAAGVFGLLCLVGGVLFRDLGLGRWKIGSLMLLWYALSYGIATTSWSHPQFGITMEISVTSVLRALWLVAVGIVAWAIGYITGPGTPARRVAGRAMLILGQRFGDEIRGPAVPWILYAVGTVARLENVATSGVFGYVGNVSSAVTTASSFGGILGAVGQCAPLGVTVAAMRVFIDRKRYAWITLVILFAAEVAFGALSGFKGSFLASVIEVAVPLSVSRRRLPAVPLILGALTFLLVVIPFNQTYRTAARQGPVSLTPGQAVSAAPGILRDSMTGSGVTSALASSAGFVMQRIREIDSVAIIDQRTPQQIPYRSPLQLVEGPLADIVPRVLWPGKPLNLTGYQFSQEYFAVPPTEYTSTAETLVGSLYLYGGWLPLLVGMFLLGCGIRLLDDLMDVRTNRHGILFVVLVFPLLVMSENDWATVLSSIPPTVFVWLLAIAITFKRARPSPDGYSPEEVRA
jgi:hypothetical protein